MKIEADNEINRFLDFIYPLIHQIGNFLQVSNWIRFLNTLVPARYGVQYIIKVLWSWQRDGRGKNCILRERITVPSHVAALCKSSGIHVTHISCFQSYSRSSYKKIQRGHSNKLHLRYHNKTGCLQEFRKNLMAPLSVL